MKDKFINIFTIKQTHTTAKFLCCGSLISLVVLASATSSFANNKEITPDREISVVRNAPYSPDWKILWDGARNLAREGHLLLAADAYAQLFSIKPNIEEANWEYCKILLRIQSFPTASKIAALLLEKNPNKIEYLLVAGQSASHQGKYIEAERFFGLIFEKEPAGKYSDVALSGLAYSLRARGLKQLAFPLMQQLVARQPGNSVVINDLAKDAVELRKYDLARQLYRTLLQNNDAEDSLILQALPVFEQEGYEVERNALYLRYLKLHPNYLPFRLKLLAVNESAGQYEDVMTHLAYIIKYSNDKDEFLLKAADVAQNKLNRQDKALDFLEQYRVLHPDETEVIALINEIQEVMAQDLLSIVQNGGAELLWNDLASIGPNRQLIFQRMAVLLESEQKKQPLIDVLEILHINNFNSSEISLQLALLLHDQKQYQKSLKYLEVIEPQDQNYEYFHLRADIELKLGMEAAALTSFTQCLALEPDNSSMRLMAVGLAGRLGRVEDQQQLFEEGAGQDYSQIPKNLLKKHIEMLALNKIYGKALDICDRAIEAHLGQVDNVDFYLLKTSILRKSGRKRHAEQILRELLQQNRFQDSVILQLVSNSLDDQKTEIARQWFEQLDKIDFNVGSSKKALDFQREKILTEIRLLRLEGVASEAFLLVDNTNNLLRSGEGASNGNKFYTRLLKEKYLLYLAVGNVQAADTLYGNSGSEFGFDPELIAMRQKYTSSRGDSGGSNSLDLYVGSVDGSRSNLLDLIDKQIEYQNVDYAKRTLKQIQQIHDDVTDSVRLKNNQVALCIADGNFKRAEVVTEDLERRFPGEDGFCRQKIDLRLKAGRYAEALDDFGRCFPGREATEGGPYGRNHQDVEVEVLYARLLWNNKRFEDALAVYARLLDPPVHKKLIDEFHEKNIDYQYLTRHQTFWSSMMLLLESDPEIIAELMAPAFLVDNRGNVTGEIVASNYELYSWQSLIEDEFLARKSIFNKKYHFAAKSYEKLIEQEESTENKVDLATIYGRIGEFRKEAQVYEELASEGEVTPELQESIKRNILQIRPTNTIDATLEERDGRQGVVDIRKSSLGTSFWFTPDLNMDFLFKYAHNTYESTDRRQKTAANILLGEMTYEFGSGYELSGLLGAEKFNGSNDGETQYNVKFNGQLDDYVSGFILFEKEPVDDTVAVLEDNLYRQFIQTGMNIETELGVSFGGDIQYSMYSDDNERNRFYLYSSYSIFGDTLQFDLRYSYQFLASKDINGPDGISSENINEDFVTSYWSPETYSEHRLGFQLKKDFFGYLTDLENKMSYFVIDTGLSLEDEETVAYSARFDIFLEMSPHLLLKGNVSLSSSDVYKDKVLSLSLHYSW
ncbi:tetratricopeptide repeat protein [Desulforhopalus sp. 52FAK]